MIKTTLIRLFLKVFSKCVINRSVSAYRNSWTLNARVGRWTRDAELWMLDPGRWTLDPGRWTLDAALWTLDSGR